MACPLSEEADGPLLLASPSHLSYPAAPWTELSSTVGMAWDQLRQEQERGRIFHPLKEGKIIFYPTYKFDRSNRDPFAYDSGEKLRVPAYTDRIFFRGSVDDSLQEVCCLPLLLSLSPAECQATRVYCLSLLAQPDTTITCRRSSIHCNCIAALFAIHLLVKLSLVAVEAMVGKIQVMAQSTSNFRQLGLQSDNVEQA